MTVKELIEWLEKYPKDTKVFIDDDSYGINPLKPDWDLEYDKVYDTDDKKYKMAVVIG